MQLWTVERPWLNNRRYLSCIPEGDYPLRTFSGTRWAATIEVADVPHRSAILFHPANRPVELAGCIAPGMDWAVESGGVPLVKSSRDAWKIVLEWFEAGDRGLTIAHEEAL